MTHKDPNAPDDPGHNLTIRLDLPTKAEILDLIATLVKPILEQHLQNLTVEPIGREEGALPPGVYTAHITSIEEQVLTSRVTFQLAKHRKKLVYRAKEPEEYFLRQFFLGNRMLELEVTQEAYNGKLYNRVIGIKETLQ